MGGEDGNVQSTSAMTSSKPSAWNKCEAQLEDACEALPAGGMVHGTTFDLFAAMSAVEIMEPLMDAGARRIQDTAAERERVDIPVQELRTEEICAVCDRWMVEEAQWMAGHTLAQSVFLCEFACQPSSTDQSPALRAYCDAARACDAFVQRAVMDGGMAGDEDFIVETFGLPLEVKDQTTQSLLARLEGAQKHATRPEDAPLKARLRFRAYFLEALDLLAQPKSAGSEEARHFLGKAKQQLRSLSEEVMEDNLKNPPGYALHAKARLTAPIPPRAAPFKDAKACFSFWDEFLSALEEASRVHEHGSSLLQLQRWLQRVARTTPPVVAMAFAAGAMRLDLPDKLGWNTTKGLLEIDLLVPMDRVLETEKGREFFDEAGKCLTDHLVSCCSNRARQHRLSRRYLEDFSVLLNLALAVETERKEDIKAWSKAYGMDSELAWAQRPFTSWTASQIARVQIMMLFKGFELDLYSTKEYCMLFWYLEYLLRCLLNAVKAWGEAYLQNNGFNSSGKVEPKASKKKGKSATLRTPSHFDGHPLRETLAYEVLEIQALHAICQGLFQMMVYLEAVEKVIIPELPYNSERERFEQRFGCLHLCQSPVPLVYPQYLDTKAAIGKASDPATASNACMVAQQCFQYARSCLQRLPDSSAKEASALDRVAASNLLTLRVLERARNQSTESWDSLCVSFHASPGDNRFRTASVRTRQQTPK